MHYYLRFPQTSQAMLMEILPPNPHNSLYTFMSTLMSLREDMRVKLKSFNESENSNVSNVIQSIEAYLYKLYGFIEYYKDRADSFATVPEFEWRSAISRLSSSKIGHIAKKGASSLLQLKENSSSNSSYGDSGGKKSFGGFYHKYTTRSFEYELAFTLTALGIGRSIIAYSRISSLDSEIINGEESISGDACYGGTNRTEEEVELEQKQINISGRDFATAAGIFQYVRDSVLPQLGNISVNILDVTSDIQYILESLALADATRLSVNRGIRSGNVKAMVLARLLLHVYEQYKQAHHILNSLPKSESKYVLDDIRRYIKDGQQVVYAQALIYLAKAYSDDNKYGLAVGFIKESQSLLKQTIEKDRSVHQRVARLLLDKVVNGQLKLYEKNNDLIGLEKVPSSSELQSFVPAGRAFVQPVSYQPSKYHLTLA